jgi:hypothetical protein
MSVAMVQRLSGGFSRPPQSNMDCRVLAQAVYAAREIRMKPNRSWSLRLCIAGTRG